MLNNKSEIKDINKTQLFKIQRPIITNELSKMLLIYNKDRSICFQMSLNQQIVALMGTELKIYVRGMIDTNQMFYIEDIVENQKW